MARKLKKALPTIAEPPTFSLKTHGIQPDRGK